MNGPLRTRALRRTGTSDAKGRHGGRGTSTDEGDSYVEAETRGSRHRRAATTRGRDEAVTKEDGCLGEGAPVDEP